MIRLVDIWKQLGGRQVLRGLNLHVPRGKTVVIIGGSGTGKSVTLKHIVGLLKPDKGQVIVNGEEITHFNKRELSRVRRKFGVLFQSGALINWLSVYDNVALPLRELTKLKEPEIEKRVREKLRLLHLEYAASYFPAEISGGMKKRVGLARALIFNPEAILYDEPTSGLDPVIASSINEMINDMKQQLNVTSIVVTHDMESAYTVGDKIAMLYEGRIVEEGAPEEIRNTVNPIVRQFIEGQVEGPITDRLRNLEGPKHPEGGAES
jgi:phospholipid/cholesterol/gamma-HCH transport system ATP-binding protein